MTRDFDGELHATGLEGGPCRGKIVVDPSSLRFEPERAGVTPVELPISDRLTVRLGGAADDLVFFSTPEQPDVTVYTRDLGILELQALRSHPDLAAATGRARRRFNWLRVSLTVAVALTLALLLGALFGAGALVAWAVEKIPPELEIELGQTMMEGLRATDGRWLEDPKIDAAIDELVQPLTGAAESHDYPFEIHVAVDPSINAFALPGGQIALHTGLILEAGSAEELQAVLAHEMAHVTERHSLRAVLRSIGFFTLAQIVFGDAGLLLEAVGRSGAELASLSLSRRQELEADRVGFDHLKRAGLKPAAMIDFLSRLEGADQALDFLSTHPATDDRIEELRARVDQEASTLRIEPSDFDLIEFQTLVRDVGGIADDGPSAESR